MLLPSIGPISLGYRLRYLSEQLTQQINTIYQQEGIQLELSQINVLFILNEKGPLISQELAKYLGISRSAISQTLSKMESKSLIQFKIDTQDARKRSIYLDKEGTLITKKLRPLWQDFSALFTNLTNSYPNLLGNIQQVTNDLEDYSLNERLSVENNFYIVSNDDPEFKLTDCAKLFKDYANFVNIGLDFQNFDEEVANLPGRYASDYRGKLYIAYLEDEAVGCTSYYAMNARDVELKRLFVAPEAQGKGLARALMKRAIHDAILDGFHTLYLDSLKRLEAARKLYEAFQFEECEPYNENPYDDVYYMKICLLTPNN